jgi:3-methylcrotonyl-CoA carboxylase alpha subunit
VPGEPLTAETPFYFMEMNTRLQIEHPVTELITGLDLVEWQFRVAAGEPLPLTQDAIGSAGAAVEARLYAEDPKTGFLPSPDKVWLTRFPEGEGVRIDSGVETGSDVPPYYDAMIAKIIGFGASRDEAYGRLLDALAATVVAGPRTNLAFLHALAERSRVEGASLSTRSIEKNLEDLTRDRRDAPSARDGAIALLERRQAEAARLRHAVSDEPRSPWDIADSFDFSGTRELSYAIEADGSQHEVAVIWDREGAHLAPRAEDDGGTGGEPEIIGTNGGVIVWKNMAQAHVRFAQAARSGRGAASGGEIRAPMFGRLTKLFVKQGDKVTSGDRIAIVEAMKMEHILHADADGIVKDVYYEEGAQVDSGAAIAEFET